MRGFEDDFDEWRKGLTQTEAKDMYMAARNEFNKTFRKSDAFGRKDIVAEDKKASLGKIMNKFLDNEAEDYVAEEARTRMPAPGLRSIGEDKVFKLRYRCVEIDRDADRMYRYASRKIDKLKEEGETFFESSPKMAYYELVNVNESNREGWVKVKEHYKKVFEEGLKRQGEIHDGLEKFVHDSGYLVKSPDGEDEKYLFAAPMSEEEKKILQDWFNKEVPKAGENLTARGSYYLSPIFDEIDISVYNAIMEMEANMTADEKAKLTEEAKEHLYRQQTMMHKIWAHEEWFKASSEVVAANEKEKALFKSAHSMPGKTKADILKEVYQYMNENLAEKPLAPLDDDVLAELEKIPASDQEDDGTDPAWGYASTLYKSEAIDNWGAKYLLGIYQTEKEAQEAFDSWNAEFEKARLRQKEELELWAKQETSRLEKDAYGKRRMAELLETAKNAL